MSKFMVWGSNFYLLSIGFVMLGMYLNCGSLVYLLEYQVYSSGSVDLGYESVVDWISCIYMGVVFFISGCVMIYSEDYMMGDKLADRFIVLMVLFVSSMMFMVLSGGLISMLLGWDGLGLISYLLVIYYNSSEVYKCGMITVLMNRIGDVSILVSIGLVMESGSWSYMMMDNLCLSNLLGMLLVFAVCTKSAQVPFSSWLPEAMAAPTPVSSLVHSSTLVTAGVFLMIRLNVFVENYFVMKLLSFLSLLTSLVAGLSALMEKDMKKIIASSTMSQMGLMSYGLSSGMWMIVYFHMMSHAFFKALMFMSMGSLLYWGGGVQDMRLMGGKFKVSLVVNQGMLLSILCLSGFPFMSGFFSKDSIIESYMMMEKDGCMYFFFLGVGMSMFYGMRMYGKAMVMLGEDSSSNMFSEGGLMNFSIVSMMLMSVGGGGIWMWLGVGVEEIVLSFEVKMMFMFLILLGVWIMIGSRLYLFEKKEGSSIYGFIGKMWGLSLLSGKMWNVFLDMVGCLSDDDQTWMEEFSSMGVVILMKNYISEYNYFLSDFFVMGFLGFLFFIMFV